MKPKFEETVMVDKWQCPWCGKENSPYDFGGTPDYDTSFIAICPSCEHECNVMPSVEFTCVPTINGDSL